MGQLFNLSCCNFYLKFDNKDIISRFIKVRKPTKLNLLVFKLIQITLAYKSKRKPNEMLFSFLFGSLKMVFKSYLQYNEKSSTPI